MNYKARNLNTLKNMLQSNETALLQKAVTDMIGTISNSADSLLSSFSVEKFFSNKSFSDLSDFIKNILDGVKNISEKAYNANINNLAFQKTINDFMKDIKINTSKTSESVNKMASADKSDNLNESIENLNKSMDLIFNPVQTLSDTIDILNTDLGEYGRNLYESGKNKLNEFIEPVKGIIESMKENMKTGFIDLFNKSTDKFNKVVDKLTDVKTYDINVSKAFKSTSGFLKSILSGTVGLFTDKKADYTEEQMKDEEKARSLKQNRLAEEQTGFLTKTLMPWLKNFGDRQALASNGLLATFFPMLANFINGSTILSKIFSWGKLMFTVVGGIFAGWKFIEGIQKAVDVLGHEIDFTSLKGWLEALNLGLGNIVSSITGIDLKTVYRWLDNFDKTLAGAYRRYLEPIIGKLWKSIKDGFTIMYKTLYNNLIKPVFDKIIGYFNDFSEKFPAIGEVIQKVYDWLTNDFAGIIVNTFDTVKNSLSSSINSIRTVFTDTSDNNEYKEIIEIFKSPVETIATTITEIMKYIGTIYTVFSETKEWKDIFKGETWTKAYEKVSESSKYTGNQYSDEIYELSQKRKEYVKSYDYLKELSKNYQNMSIQGMGISQEEIAEKGLLRSIKDNLKTEFDKQAFDRIIKDMNIDYESGGHAKEVFEAFKKERMRSFEDDFARHEKQIGDIDKKIEMYETMNRQEKFIGDQLRAGKTKEEAEKLWKRFYERTNRIEAIQESKSEQGESTMKAEQQAMNEAEREKSIQPNVNAMVGSNNNTTQINNNYNTVSEGKSPSLQSVAINSTAN